LVPLRAEQAWNRLAAAMVHCTRHKSATSVRCIVQADAMRRKRPDNLIIVDCRMRGGEDELDWNTKSRVSTTSCRLD